jgi:nucleoid-associated protein YgaU
MGNRYRTTKTKRVTETNSRKTKTKEILKTQVIPQVATSEGDIFILARYGDRLDQMAYRYYNDASLWWYIAQANNIGKGTWFITPGTVLRIPEKPSSEFDLTNELQMYNEKYR